MGAWPRLWWQKIKTHPVATVLIALLVVIIVIVVLSILGYIFNWGWTGLSQKTLWDWLQLLIIPLVVASGGFLFTLAMRRNEQQNIMDNQREVALNTYIDKMADLLLHENLRESKPDAEIRDIARARTLALLQRLNASRKGGVIKFLYETGLIKGDNCVIDLSDADLSQVNVYPELLLNLNTTLNTYDLSGVNLRGAHLEKACLVFSKLNGANLSDTMLHSANFASVNLSGANLQRSILFSAQLQGAKLDGAILDDALLIGADLNNATGTTPEQLDKAKSLRGSTMPDGSIHP